MRIFFRRAHPSPPPNASRQPPPRPLHHPRGHILVKDADAARLLISYQERDELLTLQDWIGFIGDDIDQAVDDLSEDDIDRLCEFLRKKLESIEVPF
jgi:hypothetical protein